MTTPFYRAESPRLTAFPIASAGYPFIIASGFVTLVFALLGWSIPAIAGLVLTLSICLFFRDPDRLIPDVAKAVVSPADGRVVSVGVASENPYWDGPCVKIGVFMSLLNVHVNRVPYSGVVNTITYRPGRFYPADRDSASMKNEHNAVLMDTEDHRKIAFVQIAGLVARRIICFVSEKDAIVRGARFGLICFGSRLDLYLPPDSEIIVRKGDRVKAGSSILAHLH